MTNEKIYNTKEMQTRVNDYISQFEEGYFQPLSMMARFTEEIGELAREVNHVYGEKPKKTSEQQNTIEDELGDILFVAISFANSLDLDVAKAFDKSMSKIETRDKNRWTRIEKVEDESNE
ncbi:nucleotide pyrophosphohydrolase [Aquibacillus rhizosphaerae]|uniref:Nucleotide pyrophosphohydrolase n=1 Tax=Aquibacillus rhizosphaerae TaxID=3051431 RepID=A0ABT7L4M3_9BACI|nr:nucleotide pyrophosphohydrolase [Aquibacillus sp. LR5S19]MDL4840821.1 nucleotide pyrophosphohydrolase [Aquibacillus sp. LR5S19]